MKKYLPSLSQISLKRVIAVAPTIPHFKGFSMRNLQYETRIYQKQHIKVAMSTYAKVVIVFLKQTLVCPAILKNPIDAMFQSVLSNHELKLTLWQKFHVFFKITLLCVYQQNPILATGYSSVISNYRYIILIVSTGRYIH